MGSIAMPPPVRVVHVSDSHLAAGVPFADEHWQAVVGHVAATRPDLVVHSGDITLDGAVDPAQLSFARAKLDQLPVPWVAIPGNHDIGDVDDPDRRIDEDRRARYTEAFGIGRFSRDVGAWRIVGFDLQTLASELAEAQVLGEWLEHQLDGTRPTALFMHRPLRPWGGAAEHDHRYVVEPLRARLAELITTGDVRLVGSGHVHQFLTHLDGPVEHVWAPSCWAVIPEPVQPVIGAKHVGLVEIELRGDGTSASRFVRPPGVRDVAGGVDFVLPY